MMKTNTNKLGHARGFTLIELLVVIAIIGILASVVLASLNTARNKGADAAIKGALSSARGQAELFYDTGTTYDGVCTATQANNGLVSIVLNGAQKLAAGAAVGADALAFTYSASGAAGAAVCHDTAAGWAAIISLKSPTAANAGWCVDSTGQAKEATSLTANTVVCP